MESLEIAMDDYHEHIEFNVVDGERLIFDPVRRKNFKVQPEELVRQSWIQYLSREHSISIASMSVEKTIKIGALSKRFDLVLFDKANPKVLFEFKSFNSKIRESICHQAANYNLALKVPYIILSNGIEHFAFHIDFSNNMIKPMKDLSFISSIN